MLLFNLFFINITPQHFDKRLTFVLLIGIFRCLLAVSILLIVFSQRLEGDYSLNYFGGTYLSLRRADLRGHFRGDSHRLQRIINDLTTSALDYTFLPLGCLEFRIQRLKCLIYREKMLLDLKDTIFASKRI